MNAARSPRAVSARWGVWSRKPAPAVWVLLFAAFFLAFEVAHPVADLLHQHTSCGRIVHGAPGDGPHGSGDPPRDAHGPFVPGQMSPPQLPCLSARLAGGVQPPPESPCFEPRSPVPISA